MISETAALIVAAGQGTRAGLDIPKQYASLGGVTVLRRTLDRFLATAGIDRVTVVIAQGDTAAYRTAIEDLSDTRLTAPVTGGENRMQSVRAGLEAMVKKPPSHVLIHDAARPFVSEEAILGVLKVLEVHDGAFVAVPVVDALWRTDGGFAISPRDRSGLWRAQTPQGFHFQRILDAHRAYEGEAADDVQVARASGMLVQIVEGSETNFKITTTSDFVRARAQLEVLLDAAKT